MSYFAQRSDVEARYGVNNVALFADLDGTGNTGNIAARIALALTRSDQWIWGLLYRTEYQAVLGPISSPTIVDSSGGIPSILTDVAVKYTGYWLLSARGFRDYDRDNKPLNRLAADWQDAQQTMKQIAEKTLSMDVSGVNV